MPQRHQLDDARRMIRNTMAEMIGDWTLEECRAVLGTFAAIDRIRQATESIVEPPGDLSEQRVI